MKNQVNADKRCLKLKNVDSENEIVVGLDVGSQTVRAIIGEVMPDQRINILGFGTHASEGISRGAVTDIEKVVGSIQRAVEAAELSANCQVHSVYCAISGAHIRSFNETGMVSITNEVTEDDVETAIHTAKSIKLPDDCNRLLHALEQSYRIDGQSGIKNPVGITGCRLEAYVHLIACHADSARNIEKCVAKVNNLKVDALIYSGLASADAVLTQDEKDIGVCLVDIGAGAIDLAIYSDGKLRFCKAIKYAGYYATKDVATTFSTPFQVAEKLKLQYGTVDLDEYRDKNQQVVIKSVSGDEDLSLNLETVSQVLSSRYAELLELINNEIKNVRSRMQMEGKKLQLGAGIVMTGGGSNIKGLLSLAKSVFSCQVRIGKPSLTLGLTASVNKPEFSTAVGLLIRGSQHSEYTEYGTRNSGKPITNIFKLLWQKIKENY
jgi:cell division protein FtsA